MLCFFMFFLMTVSSTPLDLVHGKKENKDVSNMMSQHRFSQALFQKKNFLSELAKADPASLNIIFGLLKDLLRVSQAASRVFTTDVNNALNDKNAKSVIVADALSNQTKSNTAKTAADLAKSSADLASEQADLALAGANGAVTTATANFDTADLHHSSMVAELNDKQPGVDAESETLRSTIALIKTLISTPSAAVSLDVSSGYDAELKRWNSLGSDQQFMDMEGIELVDGGFHFNNEVATYPFDISPTAHPQLSLEIRFKMITRTNYGWIIGHDNGGYDRGITVFDSRFGGIASGIGGKTYNSTLGYPNINEWYHVIATFENGNSQCAVYVHGEDGSTQVQNIEKPLNNKAGHSSFSVGGLVIPQLRHTVDAIISTVRVYDKVLSSDEVHTIFSQQA